MVSAPVARFGRVADDSSCELFGTWPDLASSHSVYLEAPYRIDPAEERVDFYISQGERRVANQRVMLARLEHLGADTQLPQLLLVTFETSLQLMIAQRDGRVRQLAAKVPR